MALMSSLKGLIVTGRKLRILWVRKQLFRSEVTRRSTSEGPKEWYFSTCTPSHPKRKAAHPYPQKASKNVMSPLPASVAYPSSMTTPAPGYTQWHDTSMLANATSSKLVAENDELASLQSSEADIGSKGMSRTNNSNATNHASTSRTLSNSEVTKQGSQAPVVHGLPNFSEVHGFIGSVFDPETEGHVQKLKEMDPINFETRKVLSSYDNSTKTVASGIIPKDPSSNMSCGTA